MPRAAQDWEVCACSPLDCFSTGLQHINDVVSALKCVRVAAKIVIPRIAYPTALYEDAAQDGIIMDTDNSRAWPDVSQLEKTGSQILAPLYAMQPDWVAGAISKYDSSFLAGLVRHLGAQDLAEVGVASGWSSAVMLLAQNGRGQLTGIDLSSTYYLDSNRPTGSIVSEILPEHADRFILKTGRCAFEVTAELDPLDFAFIDGHHKHPWAMLDLIALLPRLKPHAWVALHDLNLCGKPSQNHTNRGPFYLYHMWQGAKLHSTQEPTMIGAIQMGADPMEHLPFLCEMLHTPWELALSEAQSEALAVFAQTHLGEEQQAMFRQAVGA